MHLFLATGHLSIWLLVAGLFVPRLALVVAWVMAAYPPNTLPDLLNFVLWLFVPRFLIAFYLYSDTGPGNLWFWAYLVAGVLGMVGESGVVRRRAVRRRTTVTRNGNTTTTVEEEEV
jgi:hypothetical protein